MTRYYINVDKLCMMEESCQVRNKQL